MPQVSYNDFQTQENQRQEQSQRPRISYFALKNDGDEAIVRFMHDSVDDFDIMYVHTVNIGGKFRKVNCIRNPYDSIDACPFCAQSRPLNKRIYIHLIEYIRQDDGKIVGIPKIWERSSDYVTKLKNLCTEYAPLSDSIFKIKRNGVAGSMDTTYDIMFANPNIYRSDIYVKNANAFDNITALGTAVLDKNYQELSELISGENTKNNNTSVTTNTQSTSANSAYQQNKSQVSAVASTNQSSYTPQSDVASFNRPRRLYSSDEE